MNVARYSLALLALSGPLAFASELHGSHASMVRQHRIAVREDYTFLRTAKQIREFAREDRLDTVETTVDYVVDDEVSFPYARPIVKLFLARLAEQYHAATGERLVVTSLTRPISQQPRNASPLSVHPAGMAIDFRIPDTHAKRAWLESALLGLEDRGVLDVTRERHPAHYHVAVFPEQYGEYVETRIASEAETTLETVATPAAEPAPRVLLHVAAAASPVSDVPPVSPHAVLIAALGYVLAVVAAGLSTRRGRRS